MTIAAIYEHGVFRPQQPVQLPDRCEVEIAVSVRGHGDPSSRTDPSRAPRTIAEELAEIGALIPASEWESLPDDLLEQLDHYLYGTAKT